MIFLFEFSIARNGVGPLPSDSESPILPLYERALCRGGGRIRTHGGLITLVRFQIGSHNPLGHTAIGRFIVYSEPCCISLPTPKLINLRPYLTRCSKPWTRSSIIVATHSLAEDERFELPCSFPRLLSRQVSHQLDESSIVQQVGVEPTHTTVSEWLTETNRLLPLDSRYHRNRTYMQPVTLSTPYQSEEIDTDNSSIYLVFVLTSVTLNSDFSLSLSYSKISLLIRLTI